MSDHKPGRPAKPASKRRQQLHISLYPEDIARLDALTDNRSEFLRQCIAQAWEQKHHGEVKVTLTLPKWLLDGMLKTAAERLPPEQVDTFQYLMDQIVIENGIENGASKRLLG
jgi:hypothetical protein